MMRIPITAAAIILLGALPAAGQVAEPAALATVSRPAPPPLTAPQRQQLQSMITQHDQVRAKLSPSDRADLDKLTAHLRQQLFAAPLRGNLLNAAMEIVTKTIPGLTLQEAATIAEYTLGGIAGSGSAGTESGTGGAGGTAIGATASGGQDQLFDATKQMQETQMSFNLQYLQLQSQMQHEGRSYTAIGNIMKTKHDTVKNSISNIR